MIYFVAAGFCIVAIMFYLVLITVSQLYQDQKRIEKSLMLALETIQFILLEAKEAKGTKK